MPDHSGSKRTARRISLARVTGLAVAPVFDGAALIAALDAERIRRRLDWNGLAVELYGQSAELNARLGDHALCPGALVRTAKRGTMSCQYALTLLRWIGRPPEEFVAGAEPASSNVALPFAGPDQRLRWDLPALHATLDRRRRERGLTWAALGELLGCTPGRLTNLRTARLADMELTMRVTQWLGEPAARFIIAADW